jgi:hypothetical protein
MTRSSWLHTSRLLWKEGATEGLEKRNGTSWGVADQSTRSVYGDPTGWLVAAMGIDSP